MSDLSVNGNVTVLEIKKGKGIIHALRDLVKSNPNSVLTDGKLTPKEEDAAMNEIIKIQDKRLANHQTPIFTGGRDKSKSGWKTSFIVQPGQKIEFTPEEMKLIYAALGVKFKNAENASEDVNDKKVSDEQEKDNTIPPLNNDTIKAENTDTALPSSDTDISKTESKGRYELSWNEIGKIGLDSTKNFVKSMFCDENGFSVKRTATTVGLVAGLTLAAPVAATMGASAAVVGVIAGVAKLAGLGLAGYMVCSGGKNIIEGTQKYYNSKTEQDAKQNMSQALDGAVELTAALPAFLVIKGGANKGKKMASKEPKLEAPKAEEVKPAEPKVEIPKGEDIKPAEVKMERKIPEAKNLSDEKNFNELIFKLLSQDGKNKDLVKRFMEDLRDYNDPAFTEAAIRQTLTESADLLNCGLKVFVENGKILLTLDDGVTYAVKLKTAVKPATAPKTTETSPATGAKSESTQSVEAMPEFKELSVYKENDFNVSVTSNGYRQIPGNTKTVPDLRTYLNGAKDGYAVVYMPDKNVTAVVIKISGRGGDNWTLMINGKVPEAKIAEFVEYCNKNGITKLDRQLYVDFFNGKLSNTKPVEIPNSEVAKTEPQKVGQKND